MTSHKFQISTPKLQINLKKQISNSKPIFIYSVLNQFVCPYNAILPGFRLKKHLEASQNLFGSLVLGIWKLFDICFLVLGICLIQLLNIKV